MVDDLKAYLTRASIDASNPDDLEVAEESNVNKAITAAAKASNCM